MLRKDAVAARLTSDEGISYTEFSYQILQGMDYLHLFRRVRLHAADRWSGPVGQPDRRHRPDPARPTGESVHLLATPLITDGARQKFGKSEGNAVWLSAEMTSPYTFYQYWLNVEDASVGHLLRVFTDRTADEIAESLERELAERPQAREAQRTLAGDVTTLVHGAAATEAAIAASAALFGRGDLAAVDEPTLRAALTEAGLHAVTGELPTWPACSSQPGW